MVVRRGAIATEKAKKEKYENDLNGLKIQTPFLQFNFISLEIRLDVIRREYSVITTSNRVYH